MPYIQPGQTHAWCKLGEHEALIGDFQGRWRERSPDEVVWEIDTSCRFHQETKRHEAKHADLPMYVLVCRADSLARRTGTTRNFILHDPRGPRWILLLPMLRAFIDEKCVNCGRPFEKDDTGDVQFDHIHPPRKLPNGEIDWARHCARNIRILDGSCNKSKQRKADDAWIDEQYRNQRLDAERADLLPPPSCGCSPDERCLFCYRDEDGLAA